MAVNTPFLSDRREATRPLSYPVGDATVIAAGGCLDRARSPALAAVVEEALAEGRHLVVLDLQEADGQEHEAFGVVWATLRAVRRREGTLSVVGRPPMVRALESLCADGLTVHAHIGAALAAVPTRASGP